MSGLVQARYVCDDCGRDLAPAPSRAVCPCGSVRRRRVDPADVFARPATPEAPFWVQYSHPFGKPVRYDALDLAERCLITWRTFLGQRGVPLPSWG